MAKMCLNCWVREVTDPDLLQCDQCAEDNARPAPPQQDAVCCEVDGCNNLVDAGQIPRICDSCCHS